MQFNKYTKPLTILLACSLLIFLFLPYIGEEGVYTESTMEMYALHQYWVSHLFFVVYNRPPLMNWLTLGIVQLIGWKHILIATRLITILSTWVIAFFTYRLTKSLTNNTSIAWVSVLAFFGFDVITRRGWLAYADPLFAACVFAAVSLLWLGVHHKKSGLIAWSMLPLFLAFLAKVITCYLFFGVAALVLFIAYPKSRAVFFKPLVLLSYALGIAALLIYNHYTHYIQLNITQLTLDYKVSTLHHIINIFLVFPLQFLLVTLLPGSLFAWLNVRKCKQLPTAEKKVFVVALLIAVINALPYWLGHHGFEARYIMPLYPLLAICIAVLIYHANARLQRYYIKTMLVFVCVVYGLFSWGMYWFQIHKRPDYATIATSINSTAGSSPVYVAFTGLAHWRESLLAELNAERITHLPLIKPLSKDQIKPGDFIISTKRLSLTLVAKYPGKRVVFYLYRKDN